MDEPASKSSMRKTLRATLAALDDASRHQKSQAACALLTATPEFVAARVVMLYLTMDHEVDTSAIALKCWQEGKVVAVPKVSWEQRRMLPVEISSLTQGLTLTGPGVPEPISGQPVPLNLIDLVIVPGVGFALDGHRIGHGMGFYDRFLAQASFIGTSCGLGFEEQVVPALPVLDYDKPLGMLVTDKIVRRFASSLIRP